MTTLATRRAILGGLAIGLAACETAPPRLPSNTALRPPTLVATEPAPMPSDGSDAFSSRRARALQASPYGPDAMPGLAEPPGIGSDVELAPMPANRVP